MSANNCCRTCMNTASLVPLQSDKNPGFLNVLNLITGLDVQINDRLPQQICKACVDNVNKYVVFRNKCLTTQNVLISLVNQDATADISNDKAAVDCDSDNNIPPDIDSIKLESKQTSTKPDKKSPQFIQVERTIEEILMKRTPIQIENITPFTKLLLSERTQYTPMQTVQNQIKNEEASLDKKESYECKICQKTYKNHQSYERHNRIHTIKKIICEHCGRQFHHASRLLMHCKARHGYQKTDKCSYCDYVSVNADSVKIHERLHTGEKPYACELCDARFHRKSSYIQHRPIHLTEKTVQCDVCPALFKSLTLMRIHKSRHKPRRYKYRCTHCGAVFGKRWHCSRHARRVHSADGCHESVDRIRVNDGEKCQ